MSKCLVCQESTAIKVTGTNFMECPESGQVGVCNLCLADAKLGRLVRNGPTIVCLCGSTRFAAEFKSANLRETVAGRIVLSIGCDTKSDSDLIALGQLTEEKKAALDDLHKRKIDIAHEILVLNVGGYIGASTRSEIEYAAHLGKKIRWLETEEALEKAMGEAK